MLLLDSRYSFVWSDGERSQESLYKGTVQGKVGYSCSRIGSGRATNSGNMHNTDVGYSTSLQQLQRPNRLVKAINAGFTERLLYWTLKLFSEIV